MHDNRRGGGTITYISLSTHSSQVFFPPNLIKPSGIECNFVRFVDCNDDSRNAFLLCVYLPPGLKADILASFVEYVTECFDYILAIYPDASLYVCGDLNRYDLPFLSRDFNLINIVNIPTFGDAILDKFYCQSDTLYSFKITTAPGSQSGCCLSRCLC